MKWKVCGMREVQNCVEVAQLKPDFMGFIWAKKSPRYVGENFRIPEGIGAEIKRVGVFVNESVEEVIRLSKAAGFTWVQLHGEEGEVEILKLKNAGLGVIKAISVSNEADVAQVNGWVELPDYFLFDTKKGSTVGGTGERFDWNVLKSYALEVPIILAGGLDETTVQEALELSKRYPIEVLDFNSKLEVSPGLKDIGKVKRLSKLI